MFAAKSKMILHLQNSWTISKRLSDFNFFFVEWEVVFKRDIEFGACFVIEFLRSSLNIDLLPTEDNWTNFPKELTIADGCGWFE